MMSNKPQFVGEKVRLGELGKMQSGGTPPSKCPDFFTGSIPWIGTTALNGKLLDKSDAAKLITEEAIAKSATKLVPAYSIMVGIRVGVGKVAINAVPMCTSQDIVSITGIDESQWNIEFISLALQHKAPILASQAQGATITGISSKTLKSITIPVLELEIQNEIVRQLRQIQQQIESARQQVTSLDSLVKSRFVEMFGDPDSNPHGLEICPLGKVLSVQPSNGMYKPQKDYVSDGSGTPIIRIDSFRNEGPDYSSLKRLNCNESECRRYGINENDIVINRVNSVGCMGKTMLVSHIPEVTVFESNMMRLHSDEALMIPAFLCAQMTSEFSKSYFEANAKRAIGQASINQKDVKGLPVLVPTIGNQKAYLSFVAQVDKSRFAYIWNRTKPVGRHFLAPHQPWRFSMLSHKSGVSIGQMRLHRPFG